MMSLLFRKNSRVHKGKWVIVKAIGGQNINPQASIPGIIEVIKLRSSQLKDD